MPNFEFVDLRNDVTPPVISKVIDVHFNRTHQGNNVTVSQFPNVAVYEMPVYIFEFYTGLTLDSQLLGGRLLMDDMQYDEMITDDNIQVYF